MAAKAAPEGGGGDYGPDSGGYDQLGFGTLAFTRDRSTKPEGAPSPAPSASASTASGSAAAGATSAAPSPSPKPQGGRDGDLAATGSSDLPAWTTATAVTALAGGLLLLRRRTSAGRDARLGGPATGHPVIALPLLALRRTQAAPCLACSRHRNRPG